MTLVARVSTVVDDGLLPELSTAALAHIPGNRGWPVVGSTFALLADPKGQVERFASRYGPVYRSHAFGAHVVGLLGPDANEFVLFDRQRTFSSTHGWNLLLERLFPRGLMLLDFEEHRMHRRALSVAFKTEPMHAYLEGLNRGIARGVAGWLERGPVLLFYPAVKALTLDLAATSFLGKELGADIDGLKNAFIDMVAAVLGVVRVPLPGTRMRRGVRGRAYMVDYFGREIEKRRAGDGADLFTHLCKATKEDGSLLNTREIVDHMSFLMMAAHDTLTSSLTAFVWFLSDNREWQERLRAEVNSLGLVKGEPLRYEQLDDLKLTEMAFKESLRLIPPVPSIPRRAVRDTEFGGYKIPAGARVSVNPLYTHRMPDLWPDPERFDPTRFGPEAVAARHKYAYVPFGGGAHMCVGLHFALMQAKCFAYWLLSSAELSVAPGYQPVWKLWPIPQPRDGLPVNVRAA